MTLINKYINDEITDEGTLEDFIDHQHDCPDCREELELYYMLQRGLEDDEMSSDFNADLDKKLRNHDAHLIVNHGTRSLANIATILGELVVTLSALIILGRVFL